MNKGITPQLLKGVYKRKLTEYSTPEFEVWLVNGQYVRTNISKVVPQAVDFTQDGHDEV